ncbi:MAG: hypothetical protein QW273_02310 [Candidatus Pacearchaeota archaeon]
MKKAQQEIVGFVIIVILVTIGLFVFIGVMLNTKKEPVKSLEVESLLSAILKKTTDCQIRNNFPESIEGLIKDAYSNTPSNCENGERSKDYLKKILNETMNNVLKFETNFGAYRIEIKDSKTKDTLDFFSGGVCEKKLWRGSDVMLGNVQVFMYIC